MSVAVIVILAILGLFAALILVPRALMAVHAAKLKDKPAPAVHNASARRIKSGRKTVLYFHTPSCGACKLQEPIIQHVKKRHPEAVFKIDASRHREAASAYGVMAVPCLAFIDHTKVVAVKAGVQSESALLGFLAHKE